MTKSPSRLQSISYSGMLFDFSCKESLSQLVRNKTTNRDSEKKNEGRQDKVQRMKAGSSGWTWREPQERE
jgi:hypothetical protein